MKKITLYFSAVLMVFSLLGTSGCTRKTVVITGKHHKIPPGHMKKMTGSKSARPFAPGQQKRP